jgi:hypothetical protein
VKRARRSAPTSAAPTSAAPASGGAREPARGFYLLIHQLPPKPAYLRAKIGTRLARAGGVALKNSVYVLPERDDCLEDLQWIAQEARDGGGEAYVCRAEFLAGVSDDALRERFRGQASSAYETLKAEVAGALSELRRRGGAAGEDTAALRLRFRKRLVEIAKIDFFGAAAREEAQTLIDALEARARAGERKEAPAPGARRADLVGRVWVTRRDVHVDRLASAWLIRRFVDPGARFRFVEAGRGRPGAGEIGFDMVGGEFSHEGDRCTFETLMLRLGIGDPALTPIAEIVHDIDLKDAKYGRPETPGVERLIDGLIAREADDQARLSSGFALLEGLYASFGGRTEKAPAKAGPRRRGR